MARAQAFGDAPRDEQARVGAPAVRWRRVLHLARRKTPLDSPAPTFVAGALREIAKTMGE